MIVAARVIQELGRGRDQDDLVRAKISSVVAKFEEMTGRRWCRATGLTKMYALDRQQRTAPLWIHDLAVSVSLVEHAEISIYVDPVALVRQLPGVVDGDYQVETTDTGSTVLRALRSVSMTTVAVLDPGPIWKPFVRVRYDCGFDVLPKAFDDVRDAITRQVEYELARFANEKTYQKSLTGRHGGAVFFDDATHPIFKEAVHRHRVMFP